MTRCRRSSRCLPIPRRPTAPTTLSRHRHRQAISAIPCRDPIRKRGVRFGTCSDPRFQSPDIAPGFSFCMLRHPISVPTPICISLPGAFHVFVRLRSLRHWRRFGRRARRARRRVARQEGRRSPRNIATAAPASSAAACRRSSSSMPRSISEHFEDAAGFGWTVGESTFDWKKLIAAKDKEIARLEGLYRKGLDNAKARDLRYARRTGRCPYDPAAEDRQDRDRRDASSSPSAARRTRMRRCPATSSASPRTRPSIWRSCRNRS